jgi:hypothetical protein
LGVVAKALLATVGVDDGFKLAGIVLTVLSFAVRLCQHLGAERRAAIASDIAGGVGALN